MTPLRQLAATLFLPALMASAVAHAQQTPPPSAEQPAAPRAPSDWVRQPTAEQLAREFPMRAMRENISGYTRIRCLVTEKGTLTNCSVTSETPAGYGFGAAALKLSRYFVMQSKTVDGASVGGATVNIGIPFRLE